MSRSLMLELHLGIFNTQGNVKHMEIVQKLLSYVTCRWWTEGAKWQK